MFSFWQKKYTDIWFLTLSLVSWHHSPRVLVLLISVYLYHRVIGPRLTGRLCQARAVSDSGWMHPSPVSRARPSLLAAWHQLWFSPRRSNTEITPAPAWLVTALKSPPGPAWPAARRLRAGSVSRQWWSRLGSLYPTSLPPPYPCWVDWAKNNILNV